MKHALLALVTGLVLLGSGCIYVRVKGDLHDEFWDEGEGDDTAGFHELERAVDGCLADPAYDLDLAASPWRTEAEWTVRYASTGSDGHAAFRRVKEAVLRRIEREGGSVTAQHEDGPHDWNCKFDVDGDPGEASVRLVENANDDESRPHQLEVVWEESD